MKIPKGTDIRVETGGDLVELHITATITTRAQAAELAAAIKQFANVLQGEKRVRKPKAAVAA